MSALSIQPTYPIFTDIDGQPLDDGYIFIGVANLQPIGNPINVYWDAALTIPAAQPIRTISGYPANAGTPGRLYVNSDYSIQVQNKNGTLVYSAANGASDRFSSTQISFIQAGTGAVTRTVQNRLRDTISVKDFGAVGNGVIDDTPAIQAAVDAANAAGGGDVYIPPGTYMINASGNFTGIRLKSNVTIVMDDGAKLKAITSSSTDYRLVFINHVSNVGVIGGEVEGERLTHIGVTGEQGHGIYLLPGTDVYIANVKVTNCWGDGIYIGDDSENVIVENCYVENNRRNNISVTGGVNITIRNTVAKNANGTSPEAGIDIEVEPNDTVRNVLIDNCEIYDNVKDGIITEALNPLGAFVLENITLQNNKIYSNGGSGIKPSRGSNLKINNNFIYNNDSGILDTAVATNLIIAENYIDSNTTEAAIRTFSNGAKIVNNIILNSAENGISCYSQSSVIQGNRITGAAGVGIFCDASPVIVSDNNIQTCQFHGISFDTVFTRSGCIISNNFIVNVGLAADNTYNGINCPANILQPVINGNLIRRGIGNAPARAIFTGADATVVGNDVTVGAKSGNAPVEINGITTYENKWSGNTSISGDLFSSSSLIANIGFRSRNGVITNPASGTWNTMFQIGLGTGLLSGLYMIFGRARQTNVDEVIYAVFTWNQDATNKATITVISDTNMNIRLENGGLDTDNVQIQQTSGGAISFVDWTMLRIGN
jgi:polygalacturonase